LDTTEGTAMVTAGCLAARKWGRICGHLRPRNSTVSASWRGLPDLRSWITH